MQNRKRLRLLGLVAGLCLATALAVGFQKPAEGASRVYMAGNERAGTHICRCPVSAGGCVCEITN